MSPMSVRNSLESILREPQPSCVEKDRDRDVRIGIGGLWCSHSFSCSEVLHPFLLGYSNEGILRKVFL